MVEPEKPFACSIPECGMTFTNEDHLQLHTKKHDMMLQLGLEQKAAFVADQTPTPTRFIRNCEEVGLFQDLQSVNPFDEGFKRAMETKQHLLSLESIATASNTDDLHTPQMVFPLDHADSILFSTTNNQRNITISRSSSDESGAIKEFETTTISKLTNEVTTISRVVEKHDDQRTDKVKDEIRQDISYSNNIIKIHSEIRRDDTNKIYEDPNKKMADLPPIMSQTSLDFVVETLKNDFCNDAIKNDSQKLVESEDLKAKEKLKRVLTEKTMPKAVVLPKIVPITTGTLIPVTLVAQKLPITPIKSDRSFDKKPLKRRNVESKKCDVSSEKQEDLDRRSAASRRYRAKLKESWENLCSENKQLRESNDRLVSELSTLKLIITEHMKKCPIAEDIRINTTNVQHNNN